MEDSLLRGYTAESKNFRWADPDLLKRYIRETHHNIGGSFAMHYNDFSGANVFGCPINEEFLEGGTTVQYFQPKVGRLCYAMLVMR